MSPMILGKLYHSTADTNAQAFAFVGILFPHRHYYCSDDGRFTEYWCGKTHNMMMGAPQS